MTCASAAGKNVGLMSLGQIQSSPKFLLIWSTESRETQHLKAKKHKLLNLSAGLCFFNNSLPTDIECRAMHHFPQPPSTLPSETRQHWPCTRVNCAASRLILGRYANFQCWRSHFHARRRSQRTSENDLLRGLLYKQLHFETYQRLLTGRYVSC